MALAKDRNVACGENKPTTTNGSIRNKLRSALPAKNNLHPAYYAIKNESKLVNSLPKPIGCLTSSNLAELRSIWEADKRTPSRTSRGAWAASRGVNARNVHNWFLRRKGKAKKAGLEVSDETYELGLEKRCTTPEVDLGVKRELLSPPADGDVDVCTLSDDVLDRFDLDASSSTLIDLYDSSPAPGSGAYTRSVTPEPPYQLILDASRRSPSIGASIDHSLQGISRDGLPPGVACGPEEYECTPVTDIIHPFCGYGEPDRPTSDSNFTCELCRGEIDIDIPLPTSIKTLATSDETFPTFIPVDFGQDFDAGSGLSDIPFLYRFPDFVGYKLHESPEINWSDIEEEFARSFLEPSLVDFSHFTIPDSLLED